MLLVRFLRSWMRTPFMIVMEAAQYIILGVFIGISYDWPVAMLCSAPELALYDVTKQAWTAGHAWS